MLWNLKVMLISHLGKKAHKACGNEDIRQGFIIVAYLWSEGRVVFYRGLNCNSLKAVYLVTSYPRAKNTSDEQGFRLVI